jgi:GNAT superfamily N-acetyltransferase
MTEAALAHEIAAGVEFWGWEEHSGLIGVMGIQKVPDAILIRHAYVRTADQGRGIGGKLLAFLTAQAAGPLLVGAWAAAQWAIRFYQGQGFRLVSPPRTTSW